MPTPHNKTDFYRRYLAGEFGNRPRTWGTWPELRDSDYKGLVTIRDMQPGGPCHYYISSEDLRAGVIPDGVNLGRVRFNESMPDMLLTIQGNVWRDETGLRLDYSRLPDIGHRQAVRQPWMRHAAGLMALSLLHQFLTPSSLSDLYELWENYPDAVIEFSTYSVPVGTHPHRNTVFWECRAY
jgi:hypothetical protein